MKVPFTRLFGSSSAARRDAKPITPDEDGDPAASDFTSPGESLLAEMAEQVAALSAPTRSGIERAEQVRLRLVGGAGMLFGSVIGSVFVLPGLIAFTVLGLGLGYVGHVYVVHRHEKRQRRSAERWLGRKD